MSLHQIPDRNPRMLPSNNRPYKGEAYIPSPHPSNYALDSHNNNTESYLSDDGEYDPTEYQTNNNHLPPEGDNFTYYKPNHNDLPPPHMTNGHNPELGYYKHNVSRERGQEPWEAPGYECEERLNRGGGGSDYPTYDERDSHRFIPIPAERALTPNNTSLSPAFPPGVVNTMSPLARSPVPMPRKSVLSQEGAGGHNHYMDGGDRSNETTDMFYYNSRPG